MFVATEKPILKEQDALLAGTKSRQAGWLTRQSGLPALFGAQS
jgi:hypothetical protein